MFKRKVKFAELDDFDEILWQSKSAPNPRLIEEATKSLEIAPPDLRPHDSTLNLRNLRHTISWANAYTQTEIKILLDDFVSDQHSFEIVMLRSLKLSEVNVLFRLTTIGKEGWTQYRAAWRRVETDSFVCLEP